MAELEALTVSAPATSANLGPGFDCLAVALDLGNAVVITRRPGPLEVRVTGEGAGELPEDGSNLVCRALASGLPSLDDLAVECRNRIPLGRGLGSSAAAACAGLVAANALGALRWTPDELLARAAALEGHADNAAASLLGGVVVVADGRAARLPVPVQGRIVLWIPPTETHTSRSRAVLDDPVRREDAVFNVGRTALLVAAITTGSVELLRTATQDRLHQDVRLRTATDSRAAIDAALDAGAWAAWLSGSGPSVAAWCAAGEAATVAANLPPAGRHRVVDIDTQGAHVEA